MAATTMTKTQLVALMAEKIEITNKQALYFSRLWLTRRDAGQENGVFVVPGLGRLKKVQRKHGQVVIRRRARPSRLRPRPRRSSMSRKR